jgi:ribosomal protein L40E
MRLEAKVDEYISAASSHRLVSLLFHDWLPINRYHSMSTPRIVKMTLMPELKTCANCGHRVSSTATQCPRCGSLYLFGSTCKICGRDSSEKDGIGWPKQYGRDLSSLYHHACADAVLPKFRPNCCVCGADLRPPGGDRYGALLLRPYVSPYGEADPCPSCGEKRPFGFFTSCARCGFALPESDMSSPVKKSDGAHHYFHQTCARGCLGILSRIVSS